MSRLARWADARAHGRLVARISCDFPVGTADEVIGQLRRLPEAAFGGQDCERVQAALVLAAHGDWHQFVALLGLLDLDWLDVLVAGGLAHGDWPQRLGDALPLLTPT